MSSEKFSLPHHTVEEQGVVKPAPSIATVKPLIKEERKEALLDINEKNNLEEGNSNEDEEIPASETGTLGKHHGKGQGRRLGIQKDDEFFHFIIVCFSLGAVLVCEYHYSDWTVSAGIGLISFAILETIGIYFGMVYRIRTVFEQFLPIVGRFSLGFKKKE
ncbi:transmembrane protein 40 [Leptodactylus fuscus]|uniref:transmembrane protein 40 n=1 Tax=Leptodactylus fuscus TaxID=238119 RepID=UPI003F4E6F6C